MDENFRVDPVGVRAAGEQVDRHADSLRAGHAAANERIAAAHNGFIGESAAALAGLAAHWQDESASQHRELREHGEDLLDAAAKYETCDDDAAATIDAAALDLAKRMGI